MQSHSKLSILLCLAILTSVGIAEETGSADKATSQSNFPYVAEIADDNVNVRSGPGTNYYRCGKLNTGDRVKVVSTKYSWSHIVPPAGSFSWISSQYIKIDPENPQVGVVTGNSVRVYAGSEYVKPIHSTTVQAKLNRDDKVMLLGQQQGDYYKITPPEGAYLWVSSRYVSVLGPADDVPVVVGSDEKTTTLPKSPETVTAHLPVTAVKLKEYYSLEKQIQAEKAKPIEQQDYSAIKKAMQSLAADKTAAKAARYAEFATQQIKRYELAVSVAKADKVLNSNLEQIKKKIEAARTEKLTAMVDLGFAVVGKLQASTIYGSQRYRVVDAKGKIQCYAVPAGSAAGMNLTAFLNKKVGLTGVIKPDKQTAGALVTFTKIVELK
ncbi:MAG: SH3 domain-containing protein [Planctomycetota bacterium]|jgi:uncharacterized protein YgiM (DUF1202 family)